MKVLIIGNGSIRKYDRLLEYIKISDFLICCDGGMKYFFDIDILPDIIIGDFDSSDKKYFDYFKKLDIEFKKFPTEKDFTDMELCLSYAIELNPDEIFIFGGTGSRFDHYLANAHILKKALDKNITAWIIDENNKICLVNKYIKLSGEKGDLVSLIPFTENVSGIITKGLYYPLYNSQLKIGDSIGVSNVMTKEICEIFINSGILFAIMSKD